MAKIRSKPSHKKFQYVWKLGVTKINVADCMCVCVWVGGGVEGERELLKTVRLSLRGQKALWGDEFAEQSHTRTRTFGGMATAMLQLLLANTNTTTSATKDRPSRRRGGPVGFIHLCRSSSDPTARRAPSAPAHAVKVNIEDAQKREQIDTAELEGHRDAAVTRGLGSGACVTPPFKTCTFNFTEGINTLRSKNKIKN